MYGWPGLLAGIVSPLLERLGMYFVAFCTWLIGPPAKFSQTSRIAPCFGKRGKSILKMTYIQIVCPVCCKEHKSYDQKCVLLFIQELPPSLWALAHNSIESKEEIYASIIVVVFFKKNTYCCLYKSKMSTGSHIVIIWLYT